MPRRILTLLLCAPVLFWMARQNAAAQATVVEDSVYSPSLHRFTHFRVCLPFVTAASREGTASRQVPPRYPAILVLHGFDGNYRDWTDIASIQKFAPRDSIVIVTPDGENSWYVNAPGDNSAGFEDCFTRDIIPSIEHKYPIDAKHLGIAGLSMGGYGALVLGLRHPGLFCFVGSMSGSPDVPLGIPDLERNGRGGMRASLEHAFGADTSSWAGFAPERIVRTIDTASAPYLYLANGIQDEFAARLLFYRSFADVARGRGMRYEYHETPGRHSWEYWTREIDPLLRRFSELTSLR